MLYILKIELVTTNDNRKEISRFEFDYDIRFLRKRIDSKTCYDKMSDMYFESESTLNLIYQVDIKNIDIQLSGELKKATDFIRRTNYIFDWMILEVDATKGKVTAIKNQKELIANWQKIKRLLIKDYEGDDAMECLAELTDVVQDKELAVNVSSNYQYMGFLFPPVCLKHKNEWENKRLVHLSPYESKVFEEHVVFVKNVEGLRYYDITGSITPESKLNLEKFVGHMQVAEKQILPTKAALEVVYANESVINEWKFELNKFGY